MPTETIDLSDLRQQDLESRREARLRLEAKRQGLALRKDRAQMRSLGHQGGYAIIDPFNNWLILGEGFALDLDAVEAFLNEE